MNLLIISNGGHKYTTELASYLNKQEELNVYVFDKNGKSIIQYDEDFTKNIISNRVISSTDGLLKKAAIMTFNFKSLLKSLSSDYQHFFDYCIILFNDIFYPFLIRSISSRVQNIAVCIYGSDFNSASKLNRKLQQITYNTVDKIIYNNEQSAEIFSKYYNNKYNNKIAICRFGSLLIDNMNILLKTKSVDRLKEQCGFPKELKIIIIGYSATYAQQHLKILEEIFKIDHTILDKLLLVFPLTYGFDYKLKSKITNTLKDKHIKYKIITKFLSVSKLAALRLASDIMIHLPLKDQFSASFQEALYAGNIVITGNWLPYKVIEEKGADFIKINSINEISAILSKTLTDSNENLVVMKNRNAIRGLLSWEQNLPAWLNLLSGENGEIKR